VRAGAALPIIARCHCRIAVRNFADVTSFDSGDDAVAPSTSPRTGPARLARRSFLARSAAGLAGTAAATSGFTVLTGGTQAAAAPAHRRPPHRRYPDWHGPGILPSFARPRYLQVAELTESDGWTQALLATLQGVVNRRQPRIWLNLSTDGTDATWADTLRIPKHQVDDPMELLDRYRREVAGAILYDVDSPESVNVATTMAGLRGAVIATEDQAKDAHLRVLDDTRGRFTDPVQAYTWQLENLWPHCEHRLLTGITGTQTVEVPGVTWTTLAKVDQRVTDASNRKTYDIDLSGLLGGQGVFVRFADAYPDDGWGPAVYEVTVTADGTELAHFTPRTDAEDAHLFDADGSSLAPGRRFADGGSYFIYRFDPPAGTSTLTLSVLMENEYDVTGTNTAPRRVEPFPYLRDYIVATRAMVSWLSPSDAQQGPLLNRIFGSVEPTTPFLGWFPGGVTAGEVPGVAHAANNGVEVLAADFFVNASVLGGAKAHIDARPSRPRRMRLRPDIYLTLTVAEGDNVQYDEHRMRSIWDNDQRGSVPLNWTIDPVLVDLAPAIFAYYQRTATHNDLLIAGPSGAGYTYPDEWPADLLDRFTRLTGQYMRRTGLRLISVFNNAVGQGRQPLSEAAARSYARYARPDGIILNWESGTTVSHVGGVTLATDLLLPNAVDAAADKITAALADSDPDQPTFLACHVPAWQWSPADAADLASAVRASVGPRANFVRGDAFFQLADRFLASSG